MPKIVLTIRGDRNAAESALKAHGFNSWHIHPKPTGSMDDVTLVDVVAGVDHPGLLLYFWDDGSPDAQAASLQNVLRAWRDETQSSSNRVPAVVTAAWVRRHPPGSLLYWNTYSTSSHSSGGTASKRGPKIVDDLDGVEDNVKRAPLWATVRSRR
jgi:hypothetical protein